MASSAAVRDGSNSETNNPSLDYSPMRPFSRSLPMVLLLARESVMKGFRRLLREHDLTEQQWRVLRALIESDPVEISELARHTCILKPSLTRILKNLVERRLISRHRSKEDHRYALISISAKGRRIYDKHAPASEKEYARIEALFGKEKLDTLYELLDELTDLLAEE